MTSLNYHAIDTLIDRQNWWFAPSELHGMLTALTALGRAADWPAVLALGADETANTAIPELQQHVQDSLAKEDLSFQPLLADDADLPARAESLAMWAQGFSVAGDYLREHGHFPALDEAGRDFCADMHEIAKLDSRLPNTEENRQLLTDLEEHARMGALMIFAAVRSKH